MTKTPLWAIALVATCTLALAGVQVLLKTGLDRSPTPMAVATDPVVVGGVLLGIGVGFAMTFALKHGELSVLHPTIALGFVWTTIGGVLLLGETLTPTRGVGLGAIVLGVSLIGHGGRR